MNLAVYMNNSHSKQSNNGDEQQRFDFPFVEASLTAVSLFACVALRFHIIMSNSHRHCVSSVQGPAVVASRVKTQPNRVRMYLLFATVKTTYLMPPPAILFASWMCGFLAVCAGGNDADRASVHHGESPGPGDSSARALHDPLGARFSSS